MSRLVICDSCGSIIAHGSSGLCGHCLAIEAEDLHASLARAHNRLLLQQLKQTHGRPCDPPLAAIPEVTL